jgi:hypothetical protein
MAKRKKIRVLPKQCMNLRTKSDHFYAQYYFIGFCNRSEECLMCGKMDTLNMLQVQRGFTYEIFLVQQMHYLLKHKILQFIFKFRLEFITNLMHNFIYSMIILHHDPQHVSSIAVLIFRRTIVHLQYLVSSQSVCCHTVHRSRADWSIQSGTIQDTVNIQFSSWRWAQRCSKHVEDHDVILLLNK